MSDPTVKQPSLGERLRKEALDCARQHFGSDVTDAQIERVYDCEMEMFTYHCATGDDMGCVCGAHRLGGLS